VRRYFFAWAKLSGAWHKFQPALRRSKFHPAPLIQNARQPFGGPRLSSLAQHPAPLIPHPGRRLPAARQLTLLLLQHGMTPGESASERAGGLFSGAAGFHSSSQKAGTLKERKGPVTRHVRGRATRRRSTGASASVRMLGQRKQRAQTST
jgi:hypothetical protein